MLSRNCAPAKLLDAQEAAGLAGHLMIFFGHLDARKGWTKQLHLGAYRNANSRQMAALGADAGFDSIGDWPQAASIGAYLDLLDRENSLPKMIVYNLNPADNYIFATMAGNFPQEGIKGKVQFGPSWWFLDQKEGIEWQLNALSNCGLLCQFCRHGHGLALVHVLSAPRIFPPHPVQHFGQ